MLKLQALKILTLDWKINLMFGIGLVSMGIAGFTAYRSSTHYHELNQRAVHTNSLIWELENSFSLLLDIESARRGYLISGKDVFLNRVKKSTDSLTSSLDRLEKLTARTPTQKEHLDQLKLIIDEALSHSTQVLSLHKSDGLSAKAQEATVHEGKQSMDQLRMAFNDMQLEEKQRFSLAIKDAAKASDRSRLFLIAGSLLGFLLVFVAAGLANVNIFRRKRFEEELQHQKDLFQSILDCIGDGVIAVDSEGKSLVYNPAAEQIMGQGAPDAPKDQWAAIYGIYDPETLKLVASEELPLFHALNGTEIDNSELLVRSPSNPDGRIVLCTARPLTDKNSDLHGGVVVFRDITARRNAERRVRTLNSQLESKAVMLEALNKELETFSYSVSHDLRAPLRSMMGFSRILLDEHKDSLSEEGKSHLKRVVGSAQKMGQLIDGLLELSRLTRKDLHQGPLDLSELAQDIMEELKKGDPTRSVDIIIAPNLIANGDSSLLRSALQNLLENAWKFTSTTPKTKIEFGMKSQNEKKVYFVRDNGAGFEMKYYDKLFGTFQRLHANTQFEGTGIGLATTQRIIHRHGGKIWAESEISRGATFYFTL